MKLLDYFEELLIVLSLSTMIIINFGNVVSRYFIHASWSFSEELMVILFVYNSFFGASIAFKRGAHLGFTVLTDLLPPKFKKIFVFIAGATTIILMILLAKYGMEMVQSQIMFNQKTPALGLPEWTAGLSVPLGSILIIIRVIQSTFCEMKLVDYKIEASADNEEVQ